MIYFEKELNVPLRFSVVEKAEKRSIYNADDLLKLRNLRKYSKIERKGGSLILYKKTVRCPNCGREYAAPHRFRYNSNENIEYLKMQMKNLIEPQVSLLLNEDKSIVLQDDMESENLCECRRCGASGRAGNDSVNIRIMCSGNKITVSRRISGLSDIMNVLWLDDIEFDSLDKFVEEICFDLPSRKTLLYLKDCGGKVVALKNYEDININAENDVLIKIFNENRVAKRNLRRALETAFGKKMPFTCNELNMEYFVLFAKFPGFNRGFYDAVPFFDDSLRIDSTFNYIVSQLKRPESAMQALKDSALPYTKSVKRIFVNNQGLFFYIKECEMLYSALNDINYLVPALRADCIYTMLQILHKSPQTIDFIKMIFEMNGIRFLIAFFSVPQISRLSIALMYSSLSPEYRLEFRRVLKKYKIYDLCKMDVFGSLQISRPCSKITRIIPEQTINGLRFKWLKDFHSCWRAGIKLQNCLKEWNETDSAVAEIFHGVKLIAALEIKPYYNIGRYILVQAYEKKNKTIDKGSSVYNAIVCWCEQNNVEYRRFFRIR